MSLEIRIYGDPLLRKKSKKVVDVDNSIKTLINDMIKTMYNNNGIGLSAPQVGVLKRIIIVNIADGLIVLINPKILSKSGKQIGQEGCLSIPGIYLDVKRAQDILVEGLDKEGVYIQIKATGLFARALQHEIDHLNGVLITEQVPQKRLKAVKIDLEKIKKDKGEKSG